jgi:hypothetical protein
MLPNKTPKQKLKVTIPLTRHPTESPETSPLESPVKSEATASTSSGSTVRDGKHKDDDIGSGGTGRDGTERGSAEGDRTQRDGNERDSTVSLTRLRLLYPDNPDTDSLALLGLSYVNSNGTETNQQNTKIRLWNCHAVSTYHCSTFISTIPTRFQTHC